MYVGWWAQERSMDRLKENGLIEALYDAALGHQAWEQAGHQIREYMGSRHLMLSTHDPLPRRPMSS